MNGNKKEIISKNTSLTTLSTGLASRGLQVARQLAQRSIQDFTNSIGMKLVLIPKGTFIMGSPIEEEGRYLAELQREVTISKNFYLGVYQVTQLQYEKVMGINPSRFQGNKVRSDSSKHPVEMVSWDDAVEFCKRLSEFPDEKKASRVYRLPTEAEWEYACRAGSKTAYCFGYDVQTLCDYAWFDEGSGNQTHPVGEKKPNAYGLYDMHGNVWEWCSDWQEDWSSRDVTDPSGPGEGRYRVFRGGCWLHVGAFCRSASRWWNSPSSRNDYCGFRLALCSTGIPPSSEVDR